MTHSTRSALPKRPLFRNVVVATAALLAATYAGTRVAETVSPTGTVFDGAYTIRVHVDKSARGALAAGPLTITPTYVEGVTPQIQLVIEQAIRDWEATIQHSGTTPNPYPISFYE